MTSATKKRITRAGIVILAIFLLLAAWVGWEIIRVVTAEPAITVDYGAKMVELSERHQPPGENGWSVLLELIEMYERVEGEVIANAGVDAEAVDYNSIRRPDADEVEGIPVGRTLSRLSNVQDGLLARAALAALDEADVRALHDRLAMTPRAVRPAPKGSLLGWLPPELGSIRHLTKARAARMHLAYEQREDEAFVDAFEHALSLARVAAARSGIISQLTGFSCTAIVVFDLQEALIEGPPDAATLRRLMDAMDRQLPLAPISLAMEGERLMILDALQRTHSASGLLLINRTVMLGGSSDDQVHAPDSWRNLAGFSYARRNELEARVDEFFDAFARQAALDPHERSGDPFDEDVFVASIADRRYRMLDALMPAFEPPLAMRDQHDMEVAGTRLMLAIELHRATTGSYPASLDELVPTTIAALPEDPYSPQGFRYRLLDGSDSLDRHYLLYSIGPDGEDDDGVPSPTGRYSDPGHDVIVNEPR